MQGLISFAVGSPALDVCRLHYKIVAEVVEGGLTQINDAT